MAPRKPRTGQGRTRRPRNPLVPVVRGRGHGVEPSKKRYVRRPKHPRKPPEE